MKHPALTISALSLLSLLSLSLLSSCSSSQPALETVKNFRAASYAGQWHEIARLPNRFEKDLIAAKATYRSNENGSLSVLNQGLKADGERTQISGKARIVGEGKLKVRFSRFPANLFAGDYWILWINESYTKAIVGTPSRKFLWLLSKSPSTKTSDFSPALTQIKEQGFQIERLIDNPKRFNPAP